VNVFKFGGASVKDAQGVKNVVEILSNFKDEKLVVVVSAMGKTTNELEVITRDYFHGNDSLLANIETLKEKHLNIVVELGLDNTDLINDINDLFVEIDWIIETPPQDSYDYIYDQIVSVGELISSKILCQALVSAGINAAWYDIRNGLFTDEIHREAKVNWEVSQPKLKNQVAQLQTTHNIVVTQGFIGSTSENHTTTLGREGSDYTAAILSYSCDAEAMHIWKDVPGVLTADPKKFPNAVMLPEITYDEAIEMTYYGAKVIHPKTIKPLQNKSIPLYVRPFDNVDSKGTKIGEFSKINFPPIVVIEDNQALVHIAVKDFSFVAEYHLAVIFKLLADLRIKVNMMKNTAISFTLCVGNDAQKIEKLKQALDKGLMVTVIDNIQLYTIRHFDEKTIKDIVGDRTILFEDMHKQSIQIAIEAKN
jgi:aspartate kinase